MMKLKLQAILTYFLLFPLIFGDLSIYAYSRDNTFLASASMFNIQLEDDKSRYNIEDLYNSFKRKVLSEKKLPESIPRKFQSSTSLIFKNIFIISMSVFMASLYSFFFSEFSLNEYVNYFYNNIFLGIYKSVILLFNFSILFFLHLKPFSTVQKIFYSMINKNYQKYIKNIPIRTKTFTNIPITNKFETSSYPTLTIQIPVYQENFEKVIKPTLQKALKEIYSYNQFCNENHNNFSKANIIVCDDGLNFFADNNIDEVLKTIGLKLERGLSVTDLSKEEIELYSRIQFYRKNKITFIARPKPVANHPATYRAGTFKKGSNLNFTHRLDDQINDYMVKESLTYKQALKKSLSKRYFSTKVEGEIFIGEVILLLDKDSPIDDIGISSMAVPEFLDDASLSYLQCNTYASNMNENNVTKVTGFAINQHFETYVPIDILTGSVVPLIGHNVYLRKDHLKESGYWQVDRASEDYAHMKRVAHKKGCHGKWFAPLRKGGRNIGIGEDASPDYYDHANRKYRRYAYGSFEMITNSLMNIIKGKQLFNKRFLEEFLKSKNYSFWVKLDLLIFYGSYINEIFLAMLFVRTIFQPFLLFPFILVCSLYIIAGGFHNAIAKLFFYNQHKSSFFANFYIYLKRSLPFGILAMSTTFSQLVGAVYFFLGKKPSFPASDSSVTFELKKEKINLLLSLFPFISIIPSILIHNYFKYGSISAFFYTYYLTFPLTFLYLLGPIIFNPNFKEIVKSYYKDIFKELPVFLLAYFLNKLHFFQASKELLISNISNLKEKLISSYVIRKLFFHKVVQIKHVRVKKGNIYENLKNVAISDNHLIDLLFTMNRQVQCINNKSYLALEKSS